jgi:hypothetical protein
MTLPALLGVVECRAPSVSTAFSRHVRQAQRTLGHQRLETTVAHYVLDELQPGLTEGLY